MLTAEEQQELQELEQLVPALEAHRNELQVAQTELDTTVAQVTEAGNAELDQISDEADTLEAQAHAVAEEDSLEATRQNLTPSA